MVSLILIKKFNFSIPCFMLVGGERMSGEEFCLFIVCTGCKNKPHVPRNTKLAPLLQCIAPLFLSSLSSLHLLNTHIGAALDLLQRSPANRPPPYVGGALGGNSLQRFSPKAPLYTGELKLPSYIG